MAKARGTVTRSNSPKAGYVRLGEPTVEIAAWSPRQGGDPPLEQVHFVMKLPGLDFPLIMRFKSPDSLGFFIEELARFRRIVWPDCEPVDTSGEAQRGEGQ